MKIAAMVAGALLATSLVACGGGGNQNSSTTSNGTTTTSNAMSTTAPSANASAGTVAMNGSASASDGAKIFQENCSSCHGAQGQGTPGAFPPLAGNPVVTGPPTPVIHIVKDGLSGSITVSGHAFNGQMPAWGSQLSNADIAATITYIRSSWGNKASAVTEAQVASTK